MKNLLRTLIYDGQVSLTLADTTAIVEEARKLHDCAPTSTIVLGKALSAMTFMSGCLKQERGEISLSIKSDGEGKEIAVSGNASLKIRGYIANTKARGTEEECLGENGALTIIRDDGYNRPFVGTCGLSENGGMDESFEEYFRISEQLPTRIKSDVQLREDGKCIYAGVVAVQPLPFADEKTLRAVESLDLQAIIEKMRKQGVADIAIESFSVDKTVWDERTAVYKCNCSRGYLSEVLVSLGENQMRQIIHEDGAVRVHCHYCNTDYEFTNEDADKMFSKE